MSLKDEGTSLTKYTQERTEGRQKMTDLKKKNLRVEIEGKPENLDTILLAEAQINDVSFFHKVRHILQYRDTHVTSKNVWDEDLPLDPHLRAPWVGFIQRM